jgi:hypothetical protein
VSGQAFRNAIAAQVIRDYGPYEDRNGIDASVHSADYILAMPEMQAIKAALRHLAVIRCHGTNNDWRNEVALGRALGDHYPLPASVIEWVVSR